MFLFNEILIQRVVLKSALLSVSYFLLILYMIIIKSAEMSYWKLNTQMVNDKDDSIMFNALTSNCRRTLSMSTVQTPKHLILHTLLRFQWAWILSNMLCVNPSLPATRYDIRNQSTTTTLERMLLFIPKNLKVMINCQKHSTQV